MIKRPVGISILSFIYIFIVGILGIFSIVYSSNSLIVSLTNHKFDVLILSLFIVASIAFFYGKKWGWWVIGFLSLFAIISKIPYIYIGMMNLERIADPGKYFLTHAGKMMFQILIFVYLFQQNVIQFFQFQTISKLKRLGILLILNIIIFSALYFLS
jgi:hypothetical protein